MGILKEIADRLKFNNRSCEDKCIDLKTLKFDAKEGEIKLFNDFRSYYFPSDPKNPKDPKITHPAKQFCKIIGVPFNFFIKNPEYLKKEIVECWLPSLKPDKAQVLARVRNTNEENTQIIRALLPVEFTNISNVDVVEQLSEVVGDDFELEFCIGDERDDLIFHIRLISKDSFVVHEEECTCGFSVVASDLGATILSVDTMLFRKLSKASMIATYGGESFFSSDYTKMQAKDLKEIFPKVVEHVKSQFPSLKGKVQSARRLVHEKEDVMSLLRDLRLVKGLSDKFHTLMFQEIEKAGDESMSRWVFANKMAVLAKDFEVNKRIKIEKTSGDLMGLCFEKA